MTGTIMLVFSSRGGEGGDELNSVPEGRKRYVACLVFPCAAGCWKIPYPPCPPPPPVLIVAGRGNAAVLSGVGGSGSELPTQSRPDVKGARPGSRVVCRGQKTFHRLIAAGRGGEDRAVLGNTQGISLPGRYNLGGEEGDAVE